MVWNRGKGQLGVISGSSEESSSKEEMMSGEAVRGLTGGSSKCL